MMSEPYSNSIEEFYQAQKADFDKILETKSYFLIRDLPAEISKRILTPAIPNILLKQKNNGLWANSTKITYDILSALQHINILNNLITSKKMKNLSENLAERQDYDSLLIKLKIFGQTSANDITEINRHVEDIQKSQLENGSWEGTIVSTVYSIERLVNLGVPCNDQSIKKSYCLPYWTIKLKLEKTPKLHQSE